MLIIAGKFLI